MTAADVLPLTVSGGVIVTEAVLDGVGAGETVADCVTLPEALGVEVALLVAVRVCFPKQHNVYRVPLASVPAWPNRPASPLLIQIFPVDGSIATPKGL